MWRSRVNHGIWALQRRMAACQASVREAVAACDAVDARLQAVECEGDGAGEQAELQPSQSKLVRAAREAFRSLAAEGFVWLKVNAQPIAQG